MMDTRVTGMRCRAVREIRSYHGRIARFTEGTIQYHIDNLGRQLLSVEWDSGITDYAFPFEIEIIDDDEHCNDGVSKADPILWN